MAGARYGLFALVGALLSGWPDAAAAQPKDAAPAATNWVLQRGRDIPKRPPRTPKLHMEGKALSGSTGCNSFTAAVVDKAEQRVAIERVALTRKLCAEKLDRVEIAFVRALEQTQYLEQKGRKLTFLSEKREPLLVWTRNSSSAQRAARPKRPAARAHHRRRTARMRQQRRTAAYLHLRCWGWLTGAPARVRLF